MNKYRATLNILSYYNDKIIIDRIKNGEKYTYLITEPSSTEVVLGKSMILEDDVKIDNCIHDKITIYRRMGGGGTVVLSKGIIVISVGGITNISFHLREHMNSINRIIIKTLMQFGIKNISINGISDITIEDKKILGSSLYNSRNIVLYQGSLLYNPDFNIFDKYLKLPKKMPEYRKNRNHKDFVTSIIKEGYNIDLSKLMYRLNSLLGKGPLWSEISK